ncbi:hypothetical protein B0H13DRAFT_1898367 [Mycena leptocephala]|nr:hypothetical protein B0H13DRAFT_1898367 [Mycena leptocephala]
MRGPLRRCEAGLDQEVQLPEEQRERLVAALDKWRTEKQACRTGGRSLMSKRVDLPDAQLKKRADHGAEFLRAAKVTPDLICNSQSALLREGTPTEAAEHRNDPATSDHQHAALGYTVHPPFFVFAGSHDIGRNHIRIAGRVNRGIAS